jgi:hypothetical protein
VASVEEIPPSGGGGDDGSPPIPGSTNLLSNSTAGTTLVKVGPPTISGTRYEITFPVPVGSCAAVATPEFPQAGIVTVEVGAPNANSVSVVFVSAGAGGGTFSGSFHLLVSC